MPMTLPRLAELLDVFQIPMFLIAVERDGTVRYLKTNAIHREQTGFDLTGREGQTPHELFPDRMADALMANYRRCIDSGQAYSYDELLQFPKGEAWWRTVLSPIVREGNLVGIVGFSQSIDDAKAKDEGLAETVQMVQAINRDMVALTTTVAHDLRSPLRQASLIFDMLGDGFRDLGDNKGELLQQGREVIARSLQLIDDKLSYMSQGHDIGRVTHAVDLERWFGNVTSLLDPQKQLRITFPKQSVECESFLLDIALRNLIDNAVRHARYTVQIDLECDGNLLIFTVSDDGPGFPEGTVAFGKRPPDPSGVGNTPTSGFGLKTARDLVEARGGRLAIDLPRLGGPGATVSMTLRGHILEPV